MYKKDKVAKAIKRSRFMLDSVGLSSWSISTNRSYKSVATTQHHIKNIVYSDRFITIASIDDFDRVVMHEATHALLGHGKGHGKEFVTLCNRLYPSNPFDGYCVSAPIHKYNLLCNNCRNLGNSNTKEDRWCSSCASNGSGLYKLELSINKLKLKEWASTQ